MNHMNRRLSFQRKGSYPQIQKILEQEIRDGEDVLEAGCGDGLISLELKNRCPNLNLTLLDIDLKALENAKRYFGKIKVKFVRDIMRLPFQSGKFDICFNEGVIEHVNAFAALSEMSRVARKIIVFVPNGMHFKYLAWNYWSRYKKTWEWDRYGFEKDITPFHLIYWFKKNNLKITLLKFFHKEIGIIGERIIP